MEKKVEKSKEDKEEITCMGWLVPCQRNPESCSLCNGTVDIEYNKKQSCSSWAEGKIYCKEAWALFKRALFRFGRGLVFMIKGFRTRKQTDQCSIETHYDLSHVDNLGNAGVNIDHHFPGLKKKVTPYMDQPKGIIINMTSAGVDIDSVVNENAQVVVSKAKAFEAIPDTNYREVKDAILEGYKVDIPEVEMTFEEEHEKLQDKTEL